MASAPRAVAGRLADLGRLTALLPSCEAVQHELSKRGVAMSIKEVHGIGRYASQAVLTYRRRELDLYRAGKLPAANGTGKQRGRGKSKTQKRRFRADWREPKQIIAFEMDDEGRQKKGTIMAARAIYIGLDVGGTTMKAAAVDDAGKPLSEPAVSETHPDRGQDAGLATMCETIRRAAAAAGLKLDEVAAIGVATPGLMDIKAGLILDPPNLKPWKNVPVRDHIAKAFGKPTVFQNDANAAAYGEFWVGSGRDAKSMVLFTLGTGVGGGIILDDTIVEGEHSHGGELGHVRIDMPDRGRLCGCGARGCLEAYASATNVVRRAREDMAAWRGPSTLRQFYTANDDEFTAKHVFDLAAAGDELARKVVDDTAYYLALGACAVIANVDPEMIVFGGGMAVEDWFRDKIDAYVRRFGLPFPTRSVKVTFAMLGSDAGFIGAAGCARLAHKAK